VHDAAGLFSSGSSPQCAASPNNFGATRLPRPTTALVPVRKYASKHNTKKTTTMNDTDNEMLKAAQELRAMTNNQTEITVARRIVISSDSQPKRDYLIYFGDVINRGKWKWECAQMDTLEETLENIRKQITAQGDERKRELMRLEDSAAKLGLKIVEVTP
jgi:hypothetical protein